jgi:hypothetical protein
MRPFFILLPAIALAGCSPMNLADTIGATLTDNAMVANCQAADSYASAATDPADANKKKEIAANCWAAVETERQKTIEHMAALQAEQSEQQPLRSLMQPVAPSPPPAPQPPAPRNCIGVVQVGPNQGTNPCSDP